MTSERAEHGASEVGNAFGSYECLCGHISYEVCARERTDRAGAEEAELEMALTLGLDHFGAFGRSAFLRAHPFDPAVSGVAASDESSTSGPDLTVQKKNE